jgi:cytochrome b6-f complex iron-sulfur subunit
MNRRIFLKFLTSLLGVTALSTFAYTLLRYFIPPETESKSETITIAKREIPVDAAKDLFIRRIPIIVINRKDKGITVLSRVCTHFGCLVKYDKENLMLLCPCHAGKFDLEGNVISGPPPKPLQKFPFRVEGDNIVIG